MLLIELFSRPFHLGVVASEPFYFVFWKSVSHIDCPRVQFLVSKIDLFN